MMLPLISTHVLRINIRQQPETRCNRYLPIPDHQHFLARWQGTWHRKICHLKFVIACHILRVDQRALDVLSSSSQCQFPGPATRRPAHARGDPSQHCVPAGDGRSCLWRKLQKHGKTWENYEENMASKLQHLWDGIVGAAFDKGHTMPGKNSKPPTKGLCTTALTSRLQ